MCLLDALLSAAAVVQQQQAAPQVQRRVVPGRLSVKETTVFSLWLGSSRLALQQWQQVWCVAVAAVWLWQQQEQ
jgi:hypothetical protein